MHESSLRRLIPGYHLTRVVSIAKLLLEKGLFGSKAKAEAYFPGLFDPCPVRQTLNAVLEQEASRSNEEVLEVVSQSYEEHGSEGEDDRGDAVAVPAPGLADVDFTQEVKVEQDNDSDETLTPERPPASLFPLYLPYHAQHRILTNVQQVLEECIFDFMKKWLPNYLERNGWDCAAAVELTKWTKHPFRWTSQIPEEALHPTDLKIESILSKIVKVRHTAVHRLPTTARGVCDLVGIAKQLTETLGDTPRTSQLENLHHDLQDKIQILEFNKNVLEENLACHLRNIEAERELLTRREERLRAKTVEDDRENKLMMGLLLEESMEQIFRVEEVQSETGRKWLRLGNKWTSFTGTVSGWAQDRLAKNALALRLGIFALFCFIMVFVCVVGRRFMYLIRIL
ncbi:ubiquinol-cytochrome-c reductase cytochrome c1 [Aspergillus costaricaensis CBS 115574]|uniref:ubiquinol-cytochrome-c reductase cytochrome c1 n=1 Tax=Aspergillus costaricaensis CBS 115574 TaxID=1448317 RepID=UPI000DBD8B69|nr:ubiquinol-cytochrome-c reductase cytochrome c1 [Aspergillus costaricaensis CBS 115574]RAK86081.1 ubiquinol-cytochrome-c reductase cytochrome c1 [Aspergillus costaricaensis CBS 115574]